MKHLVFDENSIMDALGESSVSSSGYMVPSKLKPQQGPEWQLVERLMASIEIRLNNRYK